MARFLVAPGNVVQIEFRTDDPGFDRTFRDADLEDLQGVAVDVSDVLSAVVNDIRVDRFVAVRSSDDEQRQRRGWGPEDAEQARRKYEFVQSTFPVEDLRLRAWLKQTSKTHVPERLEWDVVTKHADDTLPPPSDPGGLAFAVVKFWGDIPYDFEMPPARLVLTMDSEDIGFMIDSLTRLRGEIEAVQRREEGRGNEAARQD